jgi:hypothetical protein
MDQGIQAVRLGREEFRLVDDFLFMIEKQDLAFVLVLDRPVESRSRNSDLPENAIVMRLFGFPAVELPPDEEGQGLLRSGIEREDEPEDGVLAADARLAGRPARPSIIDRGDPVSEMRLEEGQQLRIAYLKGLFYVLFHVIYRNKPVLSRTPASWPPGSSS